MAMQRVTLTLFTAILLTAVFPLSAAEQSTGKGVGRRQAADWSDRDYDTPLHSHVRASELIGRDVVDERREIIGTIEDLIIGLEGRLQYLVVARGGVLGIGERLIAVPFDAVEQTGGDEADIMLERGRQTLADAPSFDPVETWPDFSDPDYESELRRYFDAPRQ